MQVGTKALKNRLSFYLRRVREGESVEVTDRGTVIAELRPARARSKTSTTRALAEMANEGLIARGRGRMPDFEPVKLKRSVRVSQMILEDRR